MIIKLYYEVFCVFGNGYSIWLKGVILVVVWVVCDEWWCEWDVVNKVVVFKNVFGVILNWGDVKFVLLGWVSWWD